MQNGTHEFFAKRERACIDRLAVKVATGVNALILRTVRIT